MAAIAPASPAPTIQILKSDTLIKQKTYSMLKRFFRIFKGSSTTAENIAKKTRKKAYFDVAGRQDLNLWPFGYKMMDLNVEFQRLYMKWLIYGLVL